MVKNVFPLQQGELDFFCGIYAAINAMAERGEIEELDQASIPFRLAVFFMQSSKDWDLAKAITLGIGERDYLDLLRAMSWRDWEFHSDSDREDPDFLFKILEDSLTKSKRPAIMSLVPDKSLSYRDYPDRDVVHYTVATMINPAGIAIKDSQGETYLRKKGRKLIYKGESVKLGSLYIMPVEEP